MNIKEVYSEADVTNLKAGDRVMINGKVAMRRNQNGDGMDYIINNKNRTFTTINLRGYHLKDGEIIPVWYSKRTIDLDNVGVQK